MFIRLATASNVSNVGTYLDHLVLIYVPKAWVMWQTKDGPAVWRRGTFYLKVDFCSSSSSPQSLTTNLPTDYHPITHHTTHGCHYGSLGRYITQVHNRMIFVWVRFHEISILVYRYSQRRVTVGGSITVQLVHSLARLDLFKKWEICGFLVCSEAVESILNKQGGQPYSDISPKGKISLIEQII